jgi:hypothetical protein
MERLLLPALGLVLVAACGGKVIWSGEADGGAGGAHAKSSSTGIEENPAPSSSTGLVSNACEAFCGIPSCGGNDPSCLESCLAGYVPGCEGQADALVKCIVANVTASSCEPPPGACAKEIAAYGACTNPGQCATSSCDVETVKCLCEGTCFGSEVTALCSIVSDGSYECECMLNGNTVGSCTSADDANACDLNGGCCNQFFGSSGVEQPP